MKIQKELDETKIVLHKTIESVLERGEKIDSLVEKSDGLSAQSKMFYSTHFTYCIRCGVLNYADITLCRTGQAAEFVLCVNVTLSTAHNIVEKAILQSVVFGSIAALSTSSQK